VADRAYYEALSRDQLVARLKVAEDALVLVGWTSTSLGGDIADHERVKAAEQQWQTWCSMVGGVDFCAVENQRDVDAMIPSLAATRDRIRTEMLRAFGLEEEQR